jgi:hypothetical protein
MRFVQDCLPGTGRASAGEKPVAQITGSSTSRSRQRSAIRRVKDVEALFAQRLDESKSRLSWAI